MSRILGVDLGTVRIGVALSDPSATLASPLCTIDVRDNPDHHRTELLQLVTEHEVETVVVGVPYSLSGAIGPAARRALDEIAALRTVLAVPVETIDERLTSSEAHVRLGGAGRNARARRSVIDQSAAALILQAFLDRQRP